MAKRPRRWKARPATAALIFVCALVFVVEFLVACARADSLQDTLLASVWMLDDVELMQDAGALVATRVWLDAQWWRVGTAGLLHGSWLHLVLNMLALWAVGQWTEKAWGPWRQLVLFGTASVGGCLASLAWAEAPLVVGASAGIFGIAGALVVARAWGSDRVQGELEPVSARVLGGWLIFWLVIGFTLPLLGVSVLAQAGHVGGLIFGCAVGAIFASDRKKHRFKRFISGIGTVLGLGGLVAASFAPTWRPNYHGFMGSELLRRGEFERAAAHFDRALAGAPDDPGMANAVAYSLAEAGVELERAEELVLFSLEEEPESAEYLDTLGWIQCKQGRTEEGIATLTAAQAAATQEIPEIGEHLEVCAEVAP